MKNQRILTVQDISCVGQCSLTVALPVISACGIETAFLPSAVLSNHTAFGEFTFCDLTAEMPKIQKSWNNQGIKFSAIYTGYLGNLKQVKYVKELISTTLADDAIKIIDPAMADFGRLYSGFDADYATEMKSLCLEADIILPNITEACILTGCEYRKNLDKPFVETLLLRLNEMFGAKIILTGVSLSPDKSGIAVCEGGNIAYYEHERVGDGTHGTGDVYASAFTGALLCGKPLFEAAKIAADFTVICIKNTEADHWYGVRFEKCLPKLIEMLG